MHRIPRISPDVALQYKQWTIPPGVSPNSDLTGIYTFTQIWSQDCACRYQSACQHISCTRILSYTKSRTSLFPSVGSGTLIPSWKGIWFPLQRDPVTAWEWSKQKISLFSCSIMFFIRGPIPMNASFCWKINGPSPLSLANAEISLVLAVLFRPNGGPGFDLFETDESDVTPAHDFMLPLPRLDSKGLRVMVHWLDLNDQMTCWGLHGGAITTLPSIYSFYIPLR